MKASTCSSGTNGRGADRHRRDAPPDFAWLERLRRLYYPADRNHVAAHLTILHALPPSAEREVRSALARLSLEPPPRASIDGVMDLGGGVAFRVVSPDLELLRERLSDSFHGLLSAQDAGGWRPHVTIQNKVAPKQARALKARFEIGFQSRSLGISGLGLHHYLDGPWERIAAYSFRGC